MRLMVGMRRGAKRMEIRDGYVVKDKMECHGMEMRLKVWEREQKMDKWNERMGLSRKGEKNILSKGHDCEKL